MNKTVFRKKNVLAFLPCIFFLWFVYGRASLPGCKQHTKVLVCIFSSQYGPGKKLQKVGWNFTSFARGIALVCRKFLKNSPEMAFSEIPRKNLYWIWDKMRQISGLTDEYSPRKKTNSFTHERTFLSAPVMMNKKFIANLVGRVWGSNLSQNSIETMTNVW